MDWGPMQSVVQLAVALNAIYLSLRELRNPTVRDAQQALSDHDVKLGKSATNESAAQKLVEARTALSSLLSTFDKYDQLVGLACAVVGGAYVVLLIVTAFWIGKPEWQIATWLAIVVGIVGYLPIAVGFGLNVGLMKEIKSKITPKIVEIDHLLAKKTA